jgi:hypothetical protein
VSQGLKSLAGDTKSGFCTPFFSDLHNLIGRSTGTSLRLGKKKGL